METLESVELELNEATERARKLVESTDGRLFTVRPHLTRWSAAECVAHLSLSTESFIPPIRSALEEGRKLGPDAGARLSMDFFGRLMRWFLEPPVRTKLSTAAPFVPKAIRARAEALAEFTALQKHLIDLLHEARGLALNKMKIVSPFDSRLRYNVYSAFRIIAAHQRRHLWQAEQAVEELRGRIDQRLQPVA